MDLGQLSNQNVPQSCVAAGQTRCTVQNEGFSSCWDPGTNRAWNHVVTVYRNFEPTMLYKICNKNGGKCLGVVNGATGSANVEQRSYTGAVGQTWTIAQNVVGYLQDHQQVERPVARRERHAGRPAAAREPGVPDIDFADQSGFGNLSS